METQSQKRMGGRVFAISFNIALLVLAIFVFLNQQWILDQISLIGYTPPADVKALAVDTTMTPLAERYYYASHPTIDNRDVFKKDCGNNDEKTIILGCYTGRVIHIFDVNDPRLPGVEDVTAAHETLHAAYARLSDSERTHVNTMVEAQLKVETDQHIKDLIDAYNRTEPGQLDNEMHSILGTEVSNLSPELETYYKQYFTDRHKITNYAEKYQAVFTGLQTQQQVLVDQLNLLADSVDTRSSALSQAVAQLNSDVAVFNQKAQNSQFTSQTDFDSSRSALVARQNALQTERNDIQRLIDGYNAKHQELIDLNFEADSLNRSINSQLPAVPSV